MNKILLLLTAILLVVPTVAQDSTEVSPHFSIVHLGTGVDAVIHKPGGQAICNSGVVTLGGQVLVFDTFLSLNAANDLKSYIAGLGWGDVKYVVNSHYHNDHIRGNQVFDEEAWIISTVLIRDSIIKIDPVALKEELEYAPDRYASYKKQLEEADDNKSRKGYLEWTGYYQAMLESNPHVIPTPPEMTFMDRFLIHSTERRVELIARQHCHSREDILMYLPDDKILFTGDVLFVDGHPYLGDGNPYRLKDLLNEIKSWDVQTIVPGHGPIGTLEDVDKLILYIETLDDLSKELTSLQGTPDLAAVEIPEPFDEWGFQEFFYINLRYFYERARMIKE
jgi:glyoxylase-like metal-dependent hydrolase (beta-lactamase superfamily II)